MVNTPLTLSLPDTAKTGLVVDIAMGTVMLIIIAILIIFAFIIIGMWRGELCVLFELCVRVLVCVC